MSINDDPNEVMYQLALQIGDCLKKNQMTLTTAESCTGGGVSYLLTSVTGSSAWFDQGFVTYSNQAKQEMLNVRQESLLLWGAVSEQVACEMAVGAKQAARADVAISVTGIAGPTGGTKEKPVGTVCFGFSIGDQSMSTTQQFTGSRETVRKSAIEFALKTLMSSLRKHKLD